MPLNICGAAFIVAEVFDILSGFTSSILSIELGRRRRRRTRLHVVRTHIHRVTVVKVHYSCANMCVMNERQREDGGNFSHNNKQMQNQPVRVNVFRVVTLCV